MASDADIGLASAGSDNDIGLASAGTVSIVSAVGTIPNYQEAWPASITPPAGSVTVTLLDASPLIARSVAVVTGLGDGYQTRYHLTNPGEATAFNALCRKNKVFWNGLHIETSIDFLRKIAGNF